MLKDGRMQVLCFAPGDSLLVYKEETSPGNLGAKMAAGAQKS